MPEFGCRLGIKKAVELVEHRLNILSFYFFYFECPKILIGKVKGGMPALTIIFWIYSL